MTPSGPIVWFWHRDCRQQLGLRRLVHFLSRSTSPPISLSVLFGGCHESALAKKTAQHLPTCTGTSCSTSHHEHLEARMKVHSHSGCPSCPSFLWNREPRYVQIHFASLSTRSPTSNAEFEIPLRLNRPKWLYAVSWVVSLSAS